MINSQLVDYVQKSFEAGISVQQINEALLGQGWNAGDIGEAINKAQENISKKSATMLTPPAPPKKSEWNIDTKSLSASQILTYLGGLIIVLAGLIYVGINWSYWGPAARIFAILAPMLICFIIGTRLWFSSDYKKQGIAFVFVGSLLFPLFLAITFKELQVFATPYDSGFNFAVWFITFVLYVGLSFIFSYPIWGILYQIVGLILYYYFWRVIGVQDYSENPITAWLFLIPGTLYLFLALAYEELKKNEEATSSFVLGMIVLFFSFFRIFAETFNNTLISWVLVLIGLVYFGLGMWLEAKQIKRFCKGVYLIGAGLIFFAFLRLGFSGAILKDFAGSDKSSQDIYGASVAIVGFIYLIIALLIEQLKKFNLTEGALYKEFFDLVGPFFVLGALFYLGLGGHKPIYETLLLIGSLGFIFTSIPRKSPQFLYIGTIFLIFYIFSIGGEYFYNDVGWPLTLFVAGLASMGIGVGIEKIRRSYFGIKKI
jgi:hypothetical protein